MIDPAQELLLEACRPKPDARLLILEAGDGRLAAEIAARLPQGQLWALNRDFRAAQHAAQRLAGFSNAQAYPGAFLPASIETPVFDQVLLTIPKERRYARSLLLAAWQALEPGGELLLAGPGQRGAKAVIQDAERLFGNANTLGYRAHQRIARSVRTAELPDPLPQEFQQAGIAPGSRYSYIVERPQGRLTLETHPGIFAWEALDEGSCLLLEYLQIESGSRVWDVGCGCGVIGLSAALAGAGQVVLSDVNLIAVDYAQRNAIANGLADSTISFAADGLQLSQPLASNPTPTAFELIVTNPAFHQGHQVNKSMADELIAAAPAWLAPGGRLLLVANHFLNYDQEMRRHFRQVRRLLETNKFHVLAAW